MVAHKTAFNVVNSTIAVMGRVWCGILTCFLSEPANKQTFASIVLRSTRRKRREENPNLD